MNDPSLEYLYYIGPAVKQLGLKQFRGPFLPGPGQTPDQAVPAHFRKLWEAAPFFRNLFVTVRELEDIMPVIHQETSPAGLMRERANTWLSDPENLKKLK
jgi:hypothetical protein